MRMGDAVGKRASKMVRGLAAVGVATSIAGVAATQPSSISASLVDLTALIVVGSSTHPSGSGNEDFFQGKFNAPPYNTGDDLVHVNFLTGPFGINQALQVNSGEQNAILASGWGAANASLLLTQLNAQNDPALPLTLFILDNNVARPNGGFGTMYPWFALIGVNPFPTPTDTIAARVVDVGYQYDYNSNAPMVLLNPVAAVNSLVAWLYQRLDQSELNLPVNIDGTPSVTCAANTCGITANNVVLDCPDARCGDVPPGDRVAAYVTTKGNTTYVTYTTDELPLTRLIRDVVPLGDLIADLTEPLLTELVNSAYPDNNPIPADPSQHRVATLLPSPDQVITAAQRIPGAIQKGLTDALGGDSAASTVTTETTSTATDSGDLPEGKPLTNVVRNSEKAVPGQAPEPVGSDDKSANEALTETEPSEPAPNEIEPNDDTGPETNSGDESENHESGDAEAA
jgi:PE-PPE domain-containing protein